MTGRGVRGVFQVGHYLLRAAPDFNGDRSIPINIATDRCHGNTCLLGNLTNSDGGGSTRHKMCFYVIFCVTGYSNQLHYFNKQNHVSIYAFLKKLSGNSGNCPFWPTCYR